MGVLGRALLAGLAGLVGLVGPCGCYSPSLRDCTVSCASPSDCAGGQVCGPEGLCAAPGAAGRCSAAPDAAAPSIDAGADDAAPPRDAVAVDAEPRDAAVAMVSLHVQITGKGSVVVAGAGTCSASAPQNGDCMYDVAAGVAHTAHAVDEADQFARWTSLTCATQGATCTFTPRIATSIAARFDHMHLDVR